VLHRLRDHGNTVVVIEHNLDVIKTADWIIDLGPEGGGGGGEIMAQGAPEEIAKMGASYTGRYLAPVLEAAAQRKARAAGINRDPERPAGTRRGRKASGDILA
jgi:excinuclease ABC subunit A